MTPQYNFSNTSHTNHVLILTLVSFTWSLEVARWYTVYPKKYARGFVVLCFVVVMQSFIMNSNEVFIHIHQGCFAGTGAIVRLPQCQWSKPDGYGEISQCITTTKHSKAKTVCIFLGIYCTLEWRGIGALFVYYHLIRRMTYKDNRHGWIFSDIGTCYQLHIFVYTCMLSPLLEGLGFEVA